MLAALLLTPNQPLSSDRLIDDLWEERPPKNAAKTVQIYISRLRARLGHERILTTSAGYVLRVEAGELDATELRAAGGRGPEPRSMPGTPVALRRATAGPRTLARRGVCGLPLRRDLRRRRSAGVSASAAPRRSPTGSTRGLRSDAREEVIPELRGAGSRAAALGAAKAAADAGAVPGRAPGRRVGGLSGRALVAGRGARHRAEPQIARAPPADSQSGSGTRRSSRRQGVSEAVQPQASLSGRWDRRSTPGREGSQDHHGRLRRDRSLLRARRAPRSGDAPSRGRSRARAGQRAAERHGGSLETIAGDALTVVFGLPTVHEDDALARGEGGGRDCAKRSLGLADELAAERPSGSSSASGSAPARSSRAPTRRPSGARPASR